jgi:hypothetical protein
MNIELCIRVCREVFDGTPWFLLENGTIVTVATTDDNIVTIAMKQIAELIGPHGGEGSPLGDCNPMRLNVFDGWLVGFSLPIYTFVGDDEVDEAVRLPGSSTEVMQVDEANEVGMQEAMQRMRIGLFGRHKRNKDALDPKIIARSTDVPK